MLDSLVIDTMGRLPVCVREVAAEPVDTASAVFPLDTIVPLTGVGDTVWRSSMFARQSLSPVHGRLLERAEAFPPAWVFVVVLALVVLLYVYYLNRKIRLTDLLLSMVSRRAMDRLVRSAVLNRIMRVLPMGLLLTVSLAVAVYGVVPDSLGLVGFAGLAVGLSVGYLLRNGLLSVLGAVFERRGVVSSYITSNYIHHLVLATLVAPLLLLELYLPGARMPVFCVVVALVALVLLMRLVRGGQIFFGKSGGVSFFLFYYLCTVEILPLMVLLKWIISQ